MNLATPNWMAVAACVVFSMISGSLWFGPKTFFPAWWEAIGKKGETPVGTPVTWVLLIMTSVIQAPFMALVVGAFGRANGTLTMASGAMTGLLVWMGFVAPTGLANKLFAGRIRAWTIEAGNHLVNYVVFGAILGAWH